jgi:hypothetical protein
MKIAKFVITGVGGLLMHNPAGMRASTGEMERGGRKIPLPYDEAKAGLYIMPGGAGQLFVKPDWFREAGLIAASDVRDPSRKGRAMMTRRFSASVFITKDYCPLFRASDPTKPITDKDEDWEIDTRRVVVQKQGIVRSRPKITDWRCVLEFEYDEATMQPELIAGVLKQAGKFPGVGDYRVGKKGPFGRFGAELLNGVK